ncbi:MAG: FAD-dependent oxidoreductase, partial [Candidatus Thermoplasmatota archaeon]|nr:FAD-dependent oxidoreductase [Candidatus Thermoplasmatota archaeon]
MLSDLERRCDVLVVGAGLSGCAAAVKAFREGADVLVIESKKEVEIAGGDRTSFEALQNLVQDDDPLDFLNRIGLKVGSEIPYTGAVIHSPSGEKIDMRLRRKHGYFVRRKGPSSIDHQVVKRVMDLGIKILFGCRLDSIYKGNRVRISRNGASGEINAGTVIGADGKATTAGKGIVRPLGSRDLALGMGLQFQGEHGFEPGVAEVWLGSRICPGEYSYVLASEDEVSVVTTMRPHLIRDGMRPRDLLSNFLKIPDIAS